MRYNHMHVTTCTLCRQPSYVNRSQMLNFKCSIIAVLYFSAVLTRLFDKTCVDALISNNIMYQNFLET